MKTALFSLAAVSLLHLASAQPHRRHQAHHAAHVKKDVVTITQTALSDATEAAAAYVFVDESGKPLSTSYEYLPNAPVPTPAPAPPTSTPGVAAKVAAVASSSAAPVKASSSSSAAAAPSSPSTSGGGLGVAWTPYTSTGACTDESTIDSEIGALASAGYKVIRLYGCDCGATTSVYNAVKKHGLQIWFASFSMSTLESDIAAIIAAAAGDWTAIYHISVLNEALNSGSATLSTVLGAISTAKSLLGAAGYTGAVTTTETCQALISNPGACPDDICTCNAHSFFDSSTSAGNSGPWLKAKLAEVSQAVGGGKRIICSESGYPSGGDSNGAAVPSPENQAAALSSLKSSFADQPQNLVLFSGSTTAWKQNFAGSFMAEAFWGFN